MTGVLISVQSLEEAHVAARGGADVIDLKDPSAGSLSATCSAIWKAVGEHLAGKIPLSAALGELADLAAEDEVVLRQRFVNLRGYSFAKFGLAGMAKQPNWRATWQAVAACLPEETRPVAVIYADVHLAESPAAEEILSLAKSVRAAAVLIDTFDKSAGNLLTHFSQQQLEEIATFCRNALLPLVLAGSLSAEDIPPLQNISPGLFAFRGAVCTGGRSGEVCEQKVAQLKHAATISFSSHPIF